MRPEKARGSYQGHDSYEWSKLTTHLQSFVLVNSFSTLHIPKYNDLLNGFQEETVTRNYVSSAFVTKTAYFSLAAAALLFVSMLLMTGLHP